jgi:G3E family GTPase
MTPQIPVTVLGGYLGSGKTTMVNHLLRTANGVRLAVLVNEFGELPIDEDLIEAEDDDIISIAGGCVCCSFGSDLSGALMEMAQLDPPPNHLLIESSGVAIPSAIVGSVSLLDGFRTDGIVIVADAETVEDNARSKYMSDTVLRQLSDANIIVLNKTDLVTASALDATRDWLAEQNPDVSVIKAVHGAVPMAAVLDRFAAAQTNASPHHHTANMDMTILSPDNPVDVEKLAQDLASDARGLVRAKGFATDVSGQKMLIQVVGNRWDVSDAADDMTDGIVCLGYKAEVS